MFCMTISATTTESGEPIEQATTLTRRAQIVCDSDDSLTNEIKHLSTVFTKNNYNTDFIERNTYNRPNDSSSNSYTMIRAYEAKRYHNLKATTKYR